MTMLHRGRGRPAPIHRSRRTVSWGDAAPPSASESATCAAATPRHPRRSSASARTSPTFTRWRCSIRSTAIAALVGGSSRAMSKAVRRGVVRRIPPVSQTSSAGTTLRNTLTSSRVASRLLGAAHTTTSAPDRGAAVARAEPAALRGSSQYDWPSKTSRSSEDAALSCTRAADHPPITECAGSWAATAAILTTGADASVPVGTHTPRRTWPNARPRSVLAVTASSGASPGTITHGSVTTSGMPHMLGRVKRSVHRGPHDLWKLRLHNPPRQQEWSVPATTRRRVVAGTLHSCWRGGLWSRSFHRSWGPRCTDLLTRPSMCGMPDVVTLPWVIVPGDAPELAVTARTLRGRAFGQVRRGVWVPPGTDASAPDVRIAAVAAQLPALSVIGGWSAARVHERAASSDDLEVFDGQSYWEEPRRAAGSARATAALRGSSQYDVCAAPSSRLATRDDVRVFRSVVPADEVCETGGIRLTTPLRTAFDMARLLPPTRAAIAVDRMLHLHLVNVGDVRALALERRGWRGVAAAHVAHVHQVEVQHPGDGDRCPGRRKQPGHVEGCAQGRREADPSCLADLICGHDAPEHPDVVARRQSAAGRRAHHHPRAGPRRGRRARRTGRPPRFLPVRLAVEDLEII